MCLNLCPQQPLPSFFLNHIQNNKAKAAVKKEVLHIQEVFISKMKNILDVLLCHLGSIIWKNQDIMTIVDTEAKC